MTGPNAEAPVEEERCRYCDELFNGRCGCPQAQEAAIERAALLGLDMVEFPR